MHQQGTQGPTTSNDPHATIGGAGGLLHVRGQAHAIRGRNRLVI